jgi:hypothetical protein
VDKAHSEIPAGQSLPASSRDTTRLAGPWSETASAMREAGDLAFAMMALALARLSVHEANVATEESILYVRSRFEAQFSGSRLPFYRSRQSR